MPNVPTCTVLIAAPDALRSLEQRKEIGDGELLAFTDTDALRALEVITKRRPAIVALERLFAATPRGAALINRIKADPSLSASEIRVLSIESDHSRPTPRTMSPDGDGSATTATISPGSPASPASPATSSTSSTSSTGSGSAAAIATAPAVAPAHPLDQRGTRRAPRYRVAGSLDVLLDGNQATLVDLSTFGAQVVSATVLKPNQRVRMSLSDDQGAVRFNASVAWASFEIPPKGGPRYRAGIEFLDANGSAVDAYCSRHRT